MVQGIQICPIFIFCHPKTATLPFLWEIFFASHWVLTDFLSLETTICYEVLENEELCNKEGAENILNNNY